MNLIEFQGLLLDEAHKDKFDMDLLGSKEDSSRMLEVLRQEVLDTVGSNPEYLQLFLGLVEEAAAKNVI